MGNVLNYDRFINIFATAEDVIHIFPSDQKRITFNFDGQGADGWLAQTSWTTVIVDRVKFDALKKPDFTGSKVIGYFPGGVGPTINTDTVVIPPDMYSGPFLPASEVKVPISVFQIEFSKGTEQFQKQFLCIQNWEPQQLLGDPTKDPNFIWIVGEDSILTLETFGPVIFGEEFRVRATSNIPEIMTSSTVCRFFIEQAGPDRQIGQGFFIDNICDTVITTDYGDGEPNNIDPGTYNIYARFNGYNGYAPQRSNTATQVIQPGIPLAVDLTLTPNSSGIFQNISASAFAQVDPTFSGTLTNVTIANTVTLRVVNLNTTAYPYLNSFVITTSSFLTNPVVANFTVTDAFIDPVISSSTIFSVVTSSITQQNYIIEAVVTRQWPVEARWNYYRPGRYSGGSTSTILTVSTTKTYSSELIPIEIRSSYPRGERPSADNFYYELNPRSNSVCYSGTTTYLNAELAEAIPGFKTGISPYFDVLFTASYTSTIIKPKLLPLDYSVVEKNQITLEFPVVPPAIESNFSVENSKDGIRKFEFQDISGIETNATLQFPGPYYSNTETSTVVGVETETTRRKNYNFIYVYYRPGREGYFASPTNFFTPYIFFNNQFATFTNTNSSTVFSKLEYSNSVYPDRLKFDDFDLTPIEVGARFYINTATFKTNNESQGVHTYYPHSGYYTVTKIDAPNKTIWMDPPWGYERVIDGNGRVRRSSGNSLYDFAWWLAGEALKNQTFTFTNIDTKNTAIAQILPMTETEAQQFPKRLRVSNTSKIMPNARFLLGHNTSTRKTFVVDGKDENYIYTTESWYDWFKTKEIFVGDFVFQGLPGRNWDYMSLSTSTRVSSRPHGFNHPFAYWNCNRDIVFQNVTGSFTTATLLNFVSSTSFRINETPGLTSVGIDIGDTFFMQGKEFSVTGMDHNYNIVQTQSWIDQIIPYQMVGKEIIFEKPQTQSTGTYTFKTVTLANKAYYFPLKNTETYGVRDPNTGLYNIVTSTQFSYILQASTSTLATSSNDGLGLLNSGTYFVSARITALSSGSEFLSKMPGFTTQTYQLTVIDGYDPDITFTVSTATAGFYTFNVVKPQKTVTIRVPDRVDPRSTFPIIQYYDIPFKKPIEFYEGTNLLGVSTWTYVSLGFGEAEQKASYTIQISNVSTLSNVVAKWPGNVNDWSDNYVGTPTAEFPYRYNQVRRYRAQTIPINLSYTSTTVLSLITNPNQIYSGFKTTLSATVVGRSGNYKDNPTPTGSVILETTSGQTLTAGPLVNGAASLSFDTAIINTRSEIISIPLRAVYTGDRVRTTSTSNIVNITAYPYKNPVIMKLQPGTQSPDGSNYAQIGLSALSSSIQFATPDRYNLIISSNINSSVKGSQGQIRIAVPKLATYTYPWNHRVVVRLVGSPTGYFVDSRMEFIQGTFSDEIIISWTDYTYYNYQISYNLLFAIEQRGSSFGPIPPLENNPYTKSVAISSSI